jgi:peptidoglycan/xylan/chitin deacetylase (PgdA/CDA1 family)
MRRTWITLLTLGLGLILLFGLWRISRSRTFQLFGTLVHRVETDRRVVALTFDDGPNPRGTARILSILESPEVTATFFLTGSELQEHMEEGRTIVEAGHQLGSHSFSHRPVACTERDAGSLESSAPGNS